MSPAMSTLGSGLLDQHEGRVTMLALPPANQHRKYIEYFYEGSVQFDNGVGYVPSHKVEWIERLLHMGYILEDAADASTPEIAAANLASMEANDGYGFLASLGYAEDGPVGPSEGTTESTENDGEDEAVYDEDV